MELFLMVLVVSMAALGLTVVAFAIANTPASGSESEAAEQRPVQAASAPRFFADDPMTASVVTARRPALTAEALRLHIERHIRLEQAAAENFLARPTSQSLHSRTTSVLVN
jgi:hypothetical protein